MSFVEAPQDLNKLGRSITYEGKKTTSWKEMLVNQVSDKKFFELYEKYINQQSDTSFNKQTVLSETEFKAAVKRTKNPPAFKFQKNMSYQLFLFLAFGPCIFLKLMLSHNLVL